MILKKATQCIAGNLIIMKENFVKNSTNSCTLDRKNKTYFFKKNKKKRKPIVCILNTYRPIEYEKHIIFKTYVVLDFEINKNDQKISFYMKSWGTVRIV